MKLKKNGTVFNNHGYWYYSVKLPGDPKRRQVPLKAPGAKHTLTADRPRKLAEEAAARYWEEQTRTQRKREREEAGITVNDLCAEWIKHAAVYYRHADGTPTGEAKNAISGVRLFREMYGEACLSELTHADMLQHRDALIRSGLCRVTINMRIGTVRRMIKWALEEALTTAQVKAELTQVSNLKPGRSAARETEPVRPVANEAVKMAMANMMPNTADMVRVHSLTGMRPEEVCALRWSLIDTTQTPWVYRPPTHKNQWRGQPRVVLIGPKAREVLERHKGGGDIPFSPITAIVEMMESKRAARTSPFFPCRNESFSRAKPHAQRRPRQQWDTGSYAHTVAAACRRAGIPSWSPNRLRHAFATEVRRAFGLDACRAVLGHSTGARITDRYSYAAIEDEMIHTATAAVEALG